ncbi:hypothetical protein QYE76_025646 [Lolium multiflorum]|uniref:F-box domain-containing protein n=1 Tax=Lolium multiflorum TaxID=4521 RepID=A0AAD8RI95_LOLMU|nr:hypothetical protein QYE76_025646 [Lolium multiflorum]
MELRSGRRLRRSPPPPPPPPPMDLISSLPDEMLLLILARLRCFRAAVQTSVLSRRWRGLWIGLTDLTFRGLGPAKIEALLRRLAASPEVVSTLDISLSWTQDTASVNSLLRAAFWLSPEQLVFAFKQTHIAYHITTATSSCLASATPPRSS